MSFAKRQREEAQMESMRLQNREFRETLVGSQIDISRQANHLINGNKDELTRAIASLHCGDASQDHGTLMWCGNRFFWEIKCLDRYGLHPSHDPSDPDSTKRFMIVITATEAQ